MVSRDKGHKFTESPSKSPLFHVSDGLTGRCLDYEFLEATGEAAASATQRPVEMNDFALGVVHDRQVEFSTCAAALKLKT